MDNMFHTVFLKTEDIFIVFNIMRNNGLGSMRETIHKLIEFYVQNNGYVSILLDNITKFYI